jgi:hypothetical protein
MPGMWGTIEIGRGDEFIIRALSISLLFVFDYVSSSALKVLSTSRKAGLWGGSRKGGFSECPDPAELPASTL